MKMYRFEQDGQKMAVWPDKVFISEHREDSDKTLLISDQGSDVRGCVIDKPFDQVVEELESCRNEFEEYKISVLEGIRENLAR